MRTLEDFHPPLDGEISLCEINGRVLSRSFEFTNVNAFTNTVGILQIVSFKLTFNF